jgi:predicted flap endonuclease-1-like 5' DNA nuclease
MIYLIVQTFILLLVAGLLGLLLGWYLTRISAANQRAALQARLRAAEDKARGLRAELDATTTAKHNADTERRLLSDELADLRVRLDAAERAAEAVAVVSAGGPGQDKEADSAAISAAAVAAVEGAQELVAAPSGASDDADDLQQIKGIGPKIAGILNELGIRQFEQIAAWSATDVDWVNERLKFKGRIEREEWIPQAKALLAARDG